MTKPRLHQLLWAKIAEKERFEGDLHTLHKIISGGEGLADLHDPEVRKLLLDELQRELTDIRKRWGLDQGEEGQT